MTAPIPDEVDNSVSQFVRWLSGYGETSYDFQSFYAGHLGRKAKTLYYKHRYLGTAAVAPIIFCEAFVPAARRFFWIPQRFPIADAHYAMAFAYRFQLSGDEDDYRRAVHFLRELVATRIEGDSGYGWGYPFDWEGINGTIRKGTPLITTLPYVYEAFAAVEAIDGKKEWSDTRHSIAEHALSDYRDFPTSALAASCAYTPNQSDQGMVVNASAYRAFLLTRAAADFGDERFKQAAMRNCRFVMESQNADGSWFYSVEGKRPFVDHFHTCFVLKALAKIERLDSDTKCQAAIERGVRYYLSHLFDATGLPVPFSKAPRLTIYRRELYDYAECLNLVVLLGDQFPDLAERSRTVLEDLFDRWQKADGSFRSRQLLVGWDNVPMHRWAQAQMFRSLCAFCVNRAVPLNGTPLSRCLLP
jgi:hypothetical protein